MHDRSRMSIIVVCLFCTQSPLLQRIINLPEPKSRADEILVKRQVITTGPSIFLTEAMQRDGYDVPVIEPEHHMPHIAYLTLNPKDFLSEEMQRDGYDVSEMEPEQDMPYIAYLTTNTIGSSEPTAPTSKMDKINLSEQQQVRLRALNLRFFVFLLTF